MNEEILKKLEQKVGRRSFLKGSGLAIAAIVGAAAASPVFAQGQQQQPPPTESDKKKDDTKKDDDADAKKKDDKKDDDGADKETKIDAEGHEYRVCPQCGSNMYRQGRTWTCENCGYSYIE
jgi:anaerobic selenocysteine-containing dehydrogenase